MELLTFTEAAAFAGVSSKTIHKHVKQGKLAYVDTPLGKRIQKELLLPYRDLLGTNEKVLESADTLEVEEKRTFGSTWERVGQVQREDSAPENTVREQEGAPVLTVPLQAHLSALELAKSQLERTQAWLGEERDRVQLAQQLVLHAERSKIALEVQLNQYQRVLSENAESLAEERALRLSWQARSEELKSLVEAPSVSEAEEELRRYNESQRLLWESEKAELLQSVEAHKRRVEWLEKRVPRWVRGLFGAK